MTETTKDISELIAGIYSGYLKSRFKRVICPNCEDHGVIHVGLDLEILTELSGTEYLYAKCPICNSLYNLSDLDVLKRFKRTSRFGKPKPLVNEANRKYTDKYKLE